MFVMILFAIVGWIIGGAFFYSEVLGLFIGVLSAILYNATQKIFKLEERLKDQEEILENLLDKQFYPTTPNYENYENKVEESIQTLSKEDSILDPTLNTTLNEEVIATLPIKNIEKIKEIQSPQPSPNKEQNSHLSESLMRVFIGDNPIVRVGGIILFLGLSFFAKFLIDHSIITLEMRLAFMGLVGIGFIMLGWRWREKEGDYGLILQAIGVATLYLVIFSSAKLYHLIDLKSAFVLMLGVVLLASWLSIIQKSLPLILFSITGGFLVPILTSNESGNHILLFSYYALLNSAIVIIAYFYSWRILNLVGFAFTFIIATFWGVQHYEKELFITTEPFLILFFIFYLSINVLFTKHLKALKIKYVDTTITFGLPFIAFSFQDAMIGYNDNIMALSALVLALIYSILSIKLYSHEYSKDLSHSFFALSVIFIAIAVGYYFEAEILSIIWAVEALGTIWIALKQNRLFTRTVALILMLFSLLVSIENIASEENALLFSMPFISTLLVLGILFGILWLYHHYQDHLQDWEKSLAPYMLGFGFFIYQFIGFLKFDIYNSEKAIDYFIIYTSIVSLILMRVALRSKWKHLKNFLSSFFVIGAIFILLSGRLESPHPLYALGIIALPLFFITYHALAYFFEKQWNNATVWQVLSSILIIIILSFELYYHAHQYNLTMLYQDIAWGITALLSFALVYLGNKLDLYPFKRHQKGYDLYFLGAMSLYITFWSIILLSHVNTGYIPLLNLLDILAIGVFVALYSYINQNIEAKELPLILLGLYGVIFISILLARTMHSFGGVEYSISILDNMSYQMGLSIMWSVVAFGLMILSLQLKSRGVWIASMSLIAITVLKLLLIDMANSGTMERIISFIGAGILILIIGYFFKIPQKNTSQNSKG